MTAQEAEGVSCGEVECDVNATAISNAVHGRAIQLPEGAVSLHPALAAGWFETAVTKGRAEGGGEALNRPLPPPSPTTTTLLLLSSHLHRLILAAASSCGIFTHLGRCRMRFCPCSCSKRTIALEGYAPCPFQERPHLLVAQRPALHRHCCLCGCPQPTRATRLGRLPHTGSDSVLLSLGILLK